MFNRERKIADAMPGSFNMAKHVFAVLPNLISSSDQSPKSFIGRFTKTAELAFVIARSRELPVEKRRELIDQIIEKVKEKEGALGAYEMEQLENDLNRFLRMPSQYDLSGIS